MTISIDTAPVSEIPERLLLGSGPSAVPPRVLAALAQPTIGHMDPAFAAIMGETIELMREAFQTANVATLPISGTGSAGMEALVANFVDPGDSVVCGVNGLFGERMADELRRAEVADVANAILDGTDAVMLSQETAIGAYPVETVEMMAAIARATEKAAPYRRWNEQRVHRDARDPSYTVAYAVCMAARELELDAIVVPTLSGRSARLVSAHRPTVPILALSPGRETVRRCGLMWGVRATHLRKHSVTEELMLDSCRRVLDLGWVKPGQRVAVTAGLPSGVPGSTSLFQIQQL
ncbi:MAG TPA: pyruvate kinase [Solirubrobacteraceae bacterium]|nr:pyruvate kinase [Solirubrobacteraceae bacterium]